MSENTISILALVLCVIPGILHSFEMLFPMLSRLIVNYVLPFFGPGLPSARGSMTSAEQLGMLDAAISSMPEAKKTAAKDYIFLLIFEQRQNSLAFLSVIAGVVYAFQNPDADRAILHVLLMVMSVFFALVNANHAGIPLLGHNIKVSRNGRNVGIVFTPFWIAATVLNYMAFTTLN